MHYGDRLGFEAHRLSINQAYKALSLSVLRFPLILKKKLVVNLSNLRMECKIRD